MRKEVILAVFFGVILGGIILYGISLANNSVNKTLTPKTANPSTQNPANPTPTKSTHQQVFSLLYPQDHAVVSETTITLRGVAKPESTVAIISELNDLIVDVSPEGTFSAQINLASGANTIKVVQAIEGDKATESISISVIQLDIIPE